VAADCSTPARQPQETHGHRELTDELTAQAGWDYIVRDSNSRECGSI